jgi:outer membrane protein assembly factor BamD
MASGAAVRRWSLAAFALLSVACAGGGGVDLATLTSNSDQVIYEAAEKALKKHQYENAKKHFQRVIDSFPQSQFLPNARLGVGDVYFQEGGAGNYVLAVSAYREFLTLFPSHPKSDYAQLRVAEGFYKQRNSPDRDQTSTVKALDEYQRLLDLYPNSSYIEEARKRVRECRQTLARAEFLVGYFYQRSRQAFRAAIARYEVIVAEYPDYSGLDEVLLRMAECLTATGRTHEALPVIARLREEFPKSSFIPQAERLQESIPKPSTPAPSPQDQPPSQQPPPATPSEPPPPPELK